MWKRHTSLSLEKLPAPPVAFPVPLSPSPSLSLSFSHSLSLFFSCFITQSPFYRVDQTAPSHSLRTLWGVYEKCTLLFKCIDSSHHQHRLLCVCVFCVSPDDFKKHFRFFFFFKQLIRIYHQQMSSKWAASCTQTKFSYLKFGRLEWFAHVGVAHAEMHPFYNPSEGQGGM